MDRIVTTSATNVCREHPQLPMPSSQAATSPQSTSTIFSNDGNYPFHYFMEEHDREGTTPGSWKTKSHPTPRGIANSMTVLDQPWNQKSEQQWQSSQTESTSFFCIDTDRDSDSGSNDTAPSTISSMQNSSPVYLESSRSLFGIDTVDQIRAELDHGSPHSHDHQAIPAFSELLLHRRQRFNSYPGTVEHLQVKPLSVNSQVTSHEDDGRWCAQQSTGYQSPQHLLSREDCHFRKSSPGACSIPCSDSQLIDSFSAFSMSNRGLTGMACQQPVQKSYLPHQNPYPSHEQSQLQRLSSYYLASDTRKRCNSFSAQGVQSNQPEEKHFQRHSYPSFQQDSFDNMPSHKHQSQYMAEAQSQMKAQLLFQQRRLQEQHLLQQQVQQLHRLHTQQLKQAKQKSLEAKIQSSERNQNQHRTISDGPIYQVQFKCSHRYMMLGESVTQSVEVGSFVIVEADRGEDLGVVVLIAPRDSPLAIALNNANSAVTKAGEGELKKILRIASLQERAELTEKAKDEMEILKICREWAPEKYNLSIYLVDAEYQFDRHKLVLYYSAARRIDFREFVRDLYAVYKTRIWMQPTDANNTFRPNEIAARALATGLLSQSAIPSNLIPYEMESPEHINSIILPSSNTSNGTAGEYGEHSLRSCPPSIQISNSEIASNHWPVKVVPQAKINQQPFIQLSSSWQREQHTDRSRLHVNTALYQQHQQLQYGSTPRLDAYN